MDGSLRVSDAERDAAVERLKLATAEGRLTLDELAGRIEDAAGATTAAELERVTADLPAATAPVPVAPGGTTTSVFGDLRRDGSWVVPARSAWRTGFGDVRLDLREARLAGDEVVIEARTIFGDVDVLVPPGIPVELRGSTVFGDVREEQPAGEGAGGPRVVVEARTWFGDVKVRTSRLRERLLGRLQG